jgi:hypothetical protein
MEHTKKMILVETRQIEKLKESMLDKTLSKLDGEIYDILHRNIADDEKAKLYSNSLSRYLNIDKPSVVTTTFKSEDVTASDVVAAAASEKASESDSKNVESLVLETVPKKWKSQASRLLTHIKNNPDVTWSEKGELVLKNTTIPKTHAVDLVNDLLRKRTSTSSPSGWKQLANALKDYNIPHELIGNEDRWKYINSSHNESFAVGPIRGQRKRQRQQRFDWEPY